MIIIPIFGERPKIRNLTLLIRSHIKPALTNHTDILSITNPTIGGRALNTNTRITRKEPDPTDFTRRTQLPGLDTLQMRILLERFGFRKRPATCSRLIKEMKFFALGALGLR